MHEETGQNTDRFEAFLQTHTLGSAGICTLIILAITGVESTYDDKLRMSLWCASMAIPLLLSVYAAKDQLLAMRRVLAQRPNAYSRTALMLVTWISYVAHMLMAGSIAAMIAHRIPLAGLIFFLASFGFPWLASFIGWLVRKANATTERVSS
ncbi:hypothetical protein AB1286_26245 [Trinickia sp. NRRL B-1857]|uniref:hypothetical protein n=1 Tax=Trinickia sp. NRRL B-1857 TaxID=3162879 RepID=UPI003D2A6016